MAEKFDAFACYQDLLGATDEELCMLLSRGCTQAPLVSYEDAFIALLVRFLGLVTGLPWVRAFEQGHRPDEETTGVRDGQYGTIQLLSFEPTASWAMRSYDMPGGDDFCETIAIHGRYQFQLDVYRDSGQPVRDGQPAPMQSPVGSAIDPLIKLLARMRFDLVKEALAERCIQYGSFPVQGIRNDPALVKQTWESRATATLELFAAPSTSMQTPGFADYCKIPLELCAPENAPDAETTVCVTRPYDCKE